MRTALMLSLLGIASVLCPCRELSADEPAPAEQPGDYAFLPPRTLAAGLIRPRQLLRSEFVKELQFPPLVELKKSSPIPPEQIEEWLVFTLLGDEGLDPLAKAKPLAEPTGEDTPPPAPEEIRAAQQNPWGVRLRFAEAVTAEKVHQLLLGPTADGRLQTRPGKYQGRSYVVLERIRNPEALPPERLEALAFHQIDQTAWLVGSEWLIRQLLPPNREPSPLAAMLLQQPKTADAAFAFHWNGQVRLRAYLRDYLKQAQQDFNGGDYFARLVKAPDQLQAATGYLRLQPGENAPLVTLSLTGTDEDQTADLETTLNLGLGILGRWFVQQKTEAPKEMQPLLVRIQNLMRGLKIVREKQTVTVTLARPDELPELGRALRPLFAVATSHAPDPSARYRNHLKQLGLAMHNHHDTYNGLVPWTGPGTEHFMDKNGQMKVSWQAHLLPYLEQEPLYKQFDLGQSWLSDRNKPLIEKMPAVFQSPGVTKPNYTGWRIFAGPGAVFQPGRKLAFRDIADGLSNTVFAVQVGPDAATVWTDPTPLAFDFKNPKANKAALGTLPGDKFLVLMCDGAVRSFPTTISPELLTFLITIDGGETIDWDQLDGIRP